MLRAVSFWRWQVDDVTSLSRGGRSSGLGSITYTHAPPHHHEAEWWFTGYITYVLSYRTSQTSYIQAFDPYDDP